MGKKPQQMIATVVISFVYCSSQNLKRPATQKNATNDMSKKFIKRNRTPSIFMKRHTNSPKIISVNLKSNEIKYFTCLNAINYPITK